MLAKVFSAVFKVFTNEADSVKPGSHGKLRIVNLGLLGAGAFLS
jgi:hypothetical protein